MFNSVLLLLSAAYLSYEWFIKSAWRSKISHRMQPIYSVLIASYMLLMVVVFLRFGLQLF